MSYLLRGRDPTDVGGQQRSHTNLGWFSDVLTTLQLVVARDT